MRRHACAVRWSTLTEDHHCRIAAVPNGSGLYGLNARHPARAALTIFECRPRNLGSVRALNERGGVPMKDSKRSQPTNKPQHKAPDSKLPGNKAEDEDRDLNEALEESFPASDPPSQTQPETSVGTPADHKKK